MTTTRKIPFLLRVMVIGGLVMAVASCKVRLATRHLSRFELSASAPMSRRDVIVVVVVQSLARSASFQSPALSYLLRGGLPELEQVDWRDS